MSDTEILKNVILTLDRIDVPISFMEQISIPIYNANAKLKKLYSYISEQAVTNNSEKSETLDTDIEIGDVQIVPDGETPKEE